MDHLKLMLMSLLCCFTPFSLAAQIYLTANPPVLTAYPRSKSFALRCSLEEKQETDPPIQTIVSITLLKNRDVNILASIAADNHPINYNGTDVQSVAGSINQNVATDYLQVTWIEPKINDARQYTCLIEALDLLGHFVRFETTVSVPVQLPSVMDLLNYTENLEGLVNSLMPKFEALVNSLVPHIEEGQFFFPSSVTYSNVPANTHNNQTWERMYRVPIRFNSPYTKTPAVFISVVLVDTAPHVNTRYYTAAENINNTGFELVCGTWYDSIVNGLKVMWIAMEP